MTMVLAIPCHGRKMEDQALSGEKVDNEATVSGRMGGRAAGAAKGYKEHRGPATTLILAIGLCSDMLHKVVSHMERECNMAAAPSQMFQSAAFV